MPKGSLILAAFVLFFFLFLTPVSPLCRTGTADECTSSPKYVPGTYLINLGFDITTLTMKQHVVINLLDWEKPDGSCTMCENPLLQLGKLKQLHRLGLAITDWKANISCQQKVQHSVNQSAISLAVGMTEFKIKNDWMKELDVDMKPGANGRWILAGSDSYPTSFIKRRISQDTYIFLHHHVSCSYYKFSINKNKSVSKSFRRRVQDLPEKYDPSSKVKYLNLIGTYGTHVITELDLGARVMILTALPVCRMAFENITVSEMSHCLEIELSKSIGFDNVTKNPDFQKCKEKLEKLGYKWLYAEQLRYIEGGETSYRSAFYGTGFMTDPKVWLENAKSEPGLLSYSLEPLHTLLDKGDPRRVGLRQAVSEYVRERALWMKCTNICPPGVQLRASDSCFCECPNDNFTDSMCCPQQQGLAKLTVIIQRAEGLWGDYVTRTDAYVNLFFKGKVLCTSTVWNNNNPEWNENFDFGEIQVTDDVNNLEIHVWDEDFGWDDDILGRCILTLKPWDSTDPLKPWNSTDHVCYLSHGSLHYKYHLACGPHLGGPSCMDYIPLRPNKLFF